MVILTYILAPQLRFTPCYCSIYRYGKSRTAAWDKDFTLRYLGYSTDNGGYYYYNTPGFKNYEDTMLAVAQYAQTMAIPYRYWLADSWW